MTIYTENVNPPFKRKVRTTSFNEHFFRNQEKDLANLSPVTVSTALSRQELLTEIFSGLKTDGELRVVATYLCELPHREISFCVYADIMYEVLENYMARIVEEVEDMGGAHYIVKEGLEAMFGEHDDELPDQVREEKGEELKEHLLELEQLKKKVLDLQDLIKHFKAYVNDHYRVGF